MFCGCPNDPEEKHPNVNVCPVCLAHPGALPAPNKTAIEAVIKTGLAFGGAISPLTKFDRKNYFYPDLPKGYQISQYDAPLVAGGGVTLRTTGRTVRLTRIHLEEDTARLAHGEGATLIDYNRAGVPLMELVTEPDFRSGEEVLEFAKYLQLLLRCLGVSDADMEKGQMRIEANVSLDMGTKAELKNINSFKSVADAIDYEITRQREVLEKGERLTQETRGFDDVRRVTVRQRSKEEAHDYRYFPEPDIPPFATAPFDLADLVRHLPELPYAKLARFMREYALPVDRASLLVENKELADFFEAAASELAKRNVDDLPAAREKGRTLLFNYLTSDVAGLLGEEGAALAESKITPEHLAHLVDLIADGKILSRGAKDILRKVFEEGRDPEEIMEVSGLSAISDDATLAGAVEKIIGANPGAVADYKKGKAASLQYLLGQAMRELGGRGNPAALKTLFEERLK